MISLENLPSEALDHIIERLPHDEKGNMRLVSRRFRDLIPPCITLNVKELVNTINIHSSFPEGPFTNAFSSHHEHCLSSTRNVNAITGKVNCVRTFSFPPTIDFSFFSCAKIDHLMMCENFPLIINADNLKHFTTLLRGCTIDQISLVFDDQTSGNVSKIAPFISEIRATSVDFHLVRMEYKADDWNGDFANGLVNAGVREVSFSGHPIDRSGFSWYTNQAPNEEYPSFDILVRIFATGIKQITVNAGALIGEMSVGALGVLIEKLSSLGRTLLLNLHVRIRERMTEMYEKDDTEMRYLLSRAENAGVSLKISESMSDLNLKSDDVPFQLVCIECD